MPRSARNLVPSPVPPAHRARREPLISDDELERLCESPIESVRALALRMRCVKAKKRARYREIYERSPVPEKRRRFAMPKPRTDFVVDPEPETCPAYEIQGAWRVRCIVSGRHTKHVFRRTG